MSTEKRSISVIIPIYNRAHTIRRAVDSVLKQSFQDFELILVDDGSTDSSLEICREYEKSSNKIKVFHMEHRGVSAARNLGLRESSGGAYIRFVDSDDELPAGSLEDMIAPYLENDRIELVLADMSVNGIVTGGIKDSLLSGKDFVAKYFLSDNKIRYLYSSPCNKLYLRSVVEENGLLFDESMKYGEDAHFNFRYYACVNYVFLLNRIVYFVHHPRGEPGHLSGVPNRDIEEQFRYSLMRHNMYLEIAAQAVPDYKRVCASLFMDMLWGNTRFIRGHSDYPVVKKIVCEFDWRELLAECATETYYWGYKFLYHCLTEKKYRRLFWFFLIENRLYDLMPDGGKRVLRPLVNRCKRNFAGIQT